VPEGTAPDFGIAFFMFPLADVQGQPRPTAYLGNVERGILSDALRQVLRSWHGEQQPQPQPKPVKNKVKIKKRGPVMRANGG
jgi:hypothetical protein